MKDPRVASTLPICWNSLGAKHGARRRLQKGKSTRTLPRPPDSTYTLSIINDLSSHNGYYLNSLEIIIL